MSNQLIDMIGKKYGRLTVIARAENSAKGRARWLCKCDCGNEKIVLGKHLRNGSTQSCGCLNKERTSQACLIDLTGKRFGKLVVLERIPGRFSGKVKWKCQCDCGAIVEIVGCSLTGGKSKSCGCTSSFGEEKIAKILNENKINFKKSYYFSECNIYKNHPLRFDFGVLDKNNNLRYLIEYDGEQHYTITGGWSTETHYNNLQERDKLKNEYCLINNIPLIRIPYTEYNVLELKDLIPETSKFLIK